MLRTASRRRRGVVVALACAALTASLSACTGNVDAADTTPPTPAVAHAAATSAAGALLKQAVTALGDAKATGAAAREAAFTGAALESANAWAKVLPLRTAAQRADAELNPAVVKVIGVSREGDGREQVLVQTALKKSGAAVLALLTGDDTSGYRIAALTPMLEDSRLDPLDPTTVGSEAVGDGSGLAQDPADVVKAFADTVRYPDPAPSSLLADDALSSLLRAQAEKQAADIKALGAYTQVHEPKAVLGGLRLLDGKGAVVFAHLLRTDGIAMRKPVSFTPARDFTVLSGVKTIRTEASLRTNEIIAFVIPASGQVRVIAASDQLVGGTGR